MYKWPHPDSLLSGPADVSPDGTYNFDVAPPHNNAAYALIAVALTLTAVGALLRAYSRIWVTKKVYIEDYLALLALGSYIVFVWSMIKYIQGGGLFVHQWDIRAGNMFELAVYLFVWSVIDSLWAIPAKAAILLEWKRIFVPHGTHNGFYWGAWFLIWLNSLFYFILEFFIIFAQKPIQRNWDVVIPGSSPFDRQAIDVVATAVNLFVDVATFLLPQPVIWNLNMTKSRKIGLSFMFSLGLVSLALAAGRLHATAKTWYPWPVTGDTSYTISPLWLWYLAELTSVNLVLAAPSVPRAFSGHTALGRLLSLVLSWTGGFFSQSRTVISKSWPQTIGSAPSDRMRRLDDEDGHAMGLADLEVMQAMQDNKGYTGSRSDTDLVRSQPGTIMRTIEVDKEEENASTASLDPTHQRQHPWMEIV